MIGLKPSRALLPFRGPKDFSPPFPNPHPPKEESIPSSAQNANCLHNPFPFCAKRIALSFSLADSHQQDPYRRSASDPHPGSRPQDSAIFPLPRSEPYSIAKSVIFVMLAPFPFLIRSLSQSCSCFSLRLPAIFIGCPARNVAAWLRVFKFSHAIHGNNLLLPPFFRPFLCSRRSLAICRISFLFFGSFFKGFSIFPPKAMEFGQRYTKICWPFSVAACPPSSAPSSQGFQFPFSGEKCWYE